MTQPVSILIPCHNAATHLEECLQSAIAQDCAEIILLDDASTDNSRAIARLYNDQVQVRWHQENLGAQITRNKLIAFSTQPWIQFLDADDKLHPLKIQRQLNLSDDTDVLYSDFTIELWDASQLRETKIWNTNMYPFLESLVRWDAICQTNTFLFRRSLLEQVAWNETTAYAAGLHEQKLCLDLLKLGARFKHVAQDAATYRKGWSAGQVTNPAKARARMLTRLTFQEELMEWVQTQFGNQYADAIAMTHKRLHYELGQLGMSVETR